MKQQIWVDRMNNVTGRFAPCCFDGRITWLGGSLFQFFHSSSFYPIIFFNPLSFTRDGSCSTLVVADPFNSLFLKISILHNMFGCWCQRVYSTSCDNCSQSRSGARSFTVMVSVKGQSFTSVFLLSNTRWYIPRRCIEEALGALLNHIKTCGFNK